MGRIALLVGFSCAVAVADSSVPPATPRPSPSPAPATSASPSKSPEVRVAVDHHRAAQEWKRQALATRPPDAQKQAFAKREYALAAQAYERYLAQVPTDEEPFRILYTFFHAEALYHSEQYAAAGRQYQTVRDAPQGSQYRPDAALALIDTWQQRLGTLVWPPLRSLHGPPPPSLQAMPIPEDVRRLQAAMDEYARLFPDGGQRLLMQYKAAEIPLRYLHLDEARPRLERIVEAECRSPSVPVEAQLATEALLVSHALDKSSTRREELLSRLRGTGCDLAAQRRRDP